MLDEHALPAQAKLLTKSQLIYRIPEIRATIQSGEELSRLQRAHLIQLLLLWETYLQGELEDLDELIKLIGKVDLQSEAFRKALLWDLKSYPGATAEDRRKTKDRAFKALAGAPPKDRRMDDIEKISVSGHEFEVPERFK